MRIRRSFPLIAFAFASASCQTAFDYPAEKDESGQGRCSNGTDDDFDGLIDCDDPSCDGSCLEQDAVRCADGRDNDGDGLTDGRDARCWHLAGPMASRCASSEAVDFEERFDAVLSETRWLPFGHDPVTGSIAAQIVAPTDREGRSDSVLGFSALSDDTIATGLSSKVLFDGDWSSFELALQGLVDGGGGMRVALVPSDRAPANGPPLDGALLASLAIDVQPSGRVVLIVDGAERDAGQVARGVWHDFRLAQNGELLALKVDGTIVLEAQSQLLSAARLVVWGVGEGVVQVDDLHVRIAGRSPCGVTTPQIPLCNGCAEDSSLFSDDVGWTVSVAREETGSYCALTTDGEPGGSNALRGNSWLSDTGAVWRPGGELSGGIEGDIWLGASVARDSGAMQWRAVVVTEGAEGTSLHRLSSSNCVDWTLDASLPLPAGAHSPSYLLPGVVSPHEVYFALPAESGQGPTLWRYRSDDGESFFDDGVPVAVFPLDAAMDAPISVTRAGKHDVILTHRIAVKTGTLGLGLWVADDDTLSSWRRASNHPLLQTDGTGGGFDSQAITSGALFWDGEAGFLVYGARGQPVWDRFGESDGSPLSVSTASLVFADEPAPALPFSIPPEPGSRPGACGNNACERDETCSSCASDCGVCDGELIVADAFDDASRWTAEDGHPSVYITSLAERLVLAPGDASWMVRKLSDVVVGDFELSFDAHWVAPEGAAQEDRCPALIGLAKGSESEEVAEGVFAQLDQQLPSEAGVPAFSPYVRVGPSRFQSLEVNKKTHACRGMLTGYREAWHRVVLQRNGGEVTIAISAGSSCEGKVEGQAVTKYAGPIDAFDRVAVGWGRAGWTESCSTKAAGLSIDNVVVRSLPCLGAGQSCLDVQTQKTVCVDLASSPEHCGNCNAAVEPGERCEGGKATCGGEFCPLGDTGLEVCTDLRTSPNHCGACGQETGALEVCRDGIPVAAMVNLPEGYAIDATEVTVGQYRAWLATEPLISNQHELCAWNSSFGKKCIGQSEQPELPVTCVNWCDAYAYCAAVGKRLCTNVEWRGACSGGDAGNEYSYGVLFEPLACNGADAMHEGYSLACAPMVAAGSLSTCQSSIPGYEGVYDLNGNALEWTEACVGVAGETDSCRLYGGSTCSSQQDLRCVVMRERSRAGASADTGVRCCS